MSGGAGNTISPAGATKRGYKHDFAVQPQDTGRGESRRGRLSCHKKEAAGRTIEVKAMLTIGRRAAGGRTGSDLHSTRLVDRNWGQRSNWKWCPSQASSGCLWARADPRWCVLGRRVLPGVSLWAEWARSSRPSLILRASRATTRGFLGREQGSAECSSA